MKSLRVLAPVLLLLGGCAGYHLGPIKPTFMADVKTIAVPVFKNDTLEPRIEVLITGAIIKQIQQDGTYRIASADRADVVLEGTLKEIRRHASRSIRGNVLATREFTDTITIEYRLVRCDNGHEIDRHEVTGQTSFFVTGDLQQDERQALPLAAQDAAVRLVNQISEGW